MGLQFSSEPVEICESSGMKKYLNTALGKIITLLNERSNVSIDFSRLHTLSPNESKRLLYHATIIHYKSHPEIAENKISHLEHELKRMQIIDKPVNILTLEDPRWDFFIKEYFGPFDTCQIPIKVIETKQEKYNRNTTLIMPINDTYYTIDPDDYDPSHYPPRLIRSILSLFIPLLKRCRFIVIVPVSIFISDEEARLGQGHMNYLLLELESRQFKGPNVDTLNMYIYEPHGSLRRSTINAANLIGNTIISWLQSKQPDKGWLLNVYSTLLCPIGIQSVASKYDIGYCTIFSMVNLYMIINIWLQMLTNKNIRPIHEWGDCVEKFLTEKYTPSQLMVMMMAFANATSSQVIRSQNLQIEKLGKQKYKKDIQKYSKRDREIISSEYGSESPIKKKNIRYSPYKRTFLATS